MFRFAPAPGGPWDSNYSLFILVALISTAILPISYLLPCHLQQQQKQQQQQQQQQQY